MQPVRATTRLKEVFKRRDKIKKAILEGHEFGVPEGQSFETLVDDVLEVLPKKISRTVVWESLATLAGSEIDNKTAVETAWRIAGNTDKLKKREIVSTWTGQPYPEWVPIQVMSMKPKRNLRQLGYDVKTRILSGLSASLYIEDFWTRRFCFHLGSHLGFRPYRGRDLDEFFRMKDPRELVHLRTYVLIEPEQSVTKPVFRLFREKDDLPPGLLGHNRLLIRKRARVSEGENCPFGFPPTHFCYSCHVGHDRCAVAVHGKTYIRGFCEICERQEAFFDPSQTRELCVNCFYKQLWSS